MKPCNNVERNLKTINLNRNFVKEITKKRPYYGNIFLVIPNSEYMSVSLNFICLTRFFKILL